MTNPIGTGTRNMAINVPTDEQMVLTHAAYKAGCRSVGDYLRRLLLSGAEVQSPELAQELREIRRRYYGSAFLLLFCGSLAMSWAGAFTPRTVRTANARPARVSRSVRSPVRRAQVVGGPDGIEFNELTGGIVRPAFEEFTGGLIFPEVELTEHSEAC